jgi:rod shape determining protein RodA
MIFLRFDRRIFQHFDWTILMLVLAMCALGILSIYSAGFSVSENNFPFYVKQIQWILLGLFFMSIAYLIDYRIICQAAYLIYGISIVLLIIVFFYGYKTHGSQRWLSVGFLAFQPSELMKLSLIIVLARYFDNHNSNEHYKLKELFIPLVMVLIPCLLILKQPDLGTALVLMLLSASIIFFMGVNWRSFAVALVSGLMLSPIGWYFLKAYQKERLLTFLNPEHDPLGAGYHVLQSIIAIGSGGVFGKGFLNGSQTQLKFLPEQQTDFIFSVFAEEWGLIGAVVLAIMFLSLILWGLKIALHSRDLLGTILAFGITALISWEVFINVGMVLGVLPVVGIPLPFLSYGGSAMVCLLTAVGLLMNVSVRRFILKN